METGKSVPGVTQTSATFSKIEKIRLLLLPPIVRLAEPGPVIVSGPLMLSWPDVSTIVPLTVKSIVSAPADVFDCETASRRLPGPLSLVLVTVKVAAHSGPVSDASSDATIKCFMRFSPDDLWLDANAALRRASRRRAGRSTPSCRPSSPRAGAVSIAETARLSSRRQKPNAWMSVVHDTRVSRQWPVASFSHCRSANETRGVDHATTGLSTLQTMGGPARTSARGAIRTLDGEQRAHVVGVHVGALALRDDLAARHHDVVIGSDFAKS